MACITRSDAEVQRPVNLTSASGHHLNVPMTIEIGRSVFEAGDTWHTSRDQTLGSSVRLI